MEGVIRFKFNNVKLVSNNFSQDLELIMRLVKYKKNWDEIFSELV